jgi:hypothetical protein
MSAMKRWMLAAVVLAMGCGNGPSPDQCGQLLDHMVDIYLKKAGASVVGDANANRAELAKQKQAVAEARATDYLEACSKTMSKSRVECAMAAPDLDALSKCDEAK